MFKKTLPPQIDMFKDLSNHLSDRKASLLDDPASWHNVFLSEVTQRVDESVFAPLFNEGGRPNAPLRVLLAMMVLKEGNGWSDEQLFDNCRFNLRCMAALGLRHIDDDVPVESTYYEFRRRLAGHSAGARDGPRRGGLPVRCPRPDTGLQHQGGEDPDGLQAYPVQHRQGRPPGAYIGNGQGVHRPSGPVPSIGRAGESGHRTSRVAEVENGQQRRLPVGQRA